jgi:hypothetical protein
VVQVAHSHDLITHAVIGANTAKSFGISESAEFFNILSNSLYSDKTLAVGRETLCNAWDAHIASKRTHLPIEITLNNRELVIRDRGTGIPKDLMHEIYCVYGASTKLNDGTQTGGFGLGCKAPFAYAEHFEVTNFNAGMKTVYRISKSSGEVGGKPGLMEILSVPCDETGIEVRIEMKSSYDAQLFDKVIRRIVGAGEMFAMLNGKLLETLPFSGAKEGYLITRKDEMVASHSSCRIFVRYGNVIYPAEEHAGYQSAYQAALTLLKALPGSHSYTPSWYLVLQAEPNTISITPSRETLQITDHTVNTLLKLLTQFRDKNVRCFEAEAQRINQVCIEKKFLAANPAAVLNPKKIIIGLKEDHISENTLHTFEQVSRALISKSYPLGAKFRKQDLELRLRSLIESGYGNRGKIQSFLAELNVKRSVLDPGSDWFHRRIVAPLIIKMKTEESVTPDRLLVYGKNADRSVRERRFSYAENTFTEARRFSKDDLESYLPYLRNMILLTCNRKDVEERAPHFPEMKHWFGPVADSLVYVVHRSDNKIAAAKEFFTKQGFRVVDLTKRYPGEQVAVVEEDNIREYKPRKAGIPILSSILPAGSKSISTDRAKADDVTRIVKPEFIVKCGARNDANTFDTFGPHISELIVRLFGDKGGIVVNESQANKYLDAGARPALAWLLDRVIEELKTNPRIQQHLPVDYASYPEAVVGYDFDKQKLIKIVCEDFALSAYFDVSTTITKVDKDYLDLWAYLEAQLKYKEKDKILDAQTFLKGFPTSDNLKKLVSSVRRSKLTNLLSPSSLEKLLKTTEDTPTINMQKAKARDFLICAISG